MRILDMNELCGNKLPLGASTIRRMVRNGVFPAPKKIFGSRKGWLESDVDAWIQDNFVAKEEKVERDGGNWLAAFSGLDSRS